MSARVLGRGIAALVRTGAASSPTASVATSAPLNRIGEVTVKSPLAGDTKTYAVGHGTLYFLVDEAGDVDAFGNPRAQVVDFDSLSAADLVQTIGELCKKVTEQETVIADLQEKVKLAAGRQRG